jgi:hypothetical protein
MQEQGLVRVQRYIGGGCDATITSRGYLEAMGKGVTPKVPARGKPVQVPPDPGAARRRLQELFGRLEELAAQERSLTLEEVEEWKEWTATVVRRIYGEKSPQLRDFEGVMSGSWPGPTVPSLAGYRRRLPRWRTLLTAWIREIDEFDTPGQPVEHYVSPGSQFSAYVLLKDTLEGAAGSITLVDPYTDDATLEPLVSAGRGVSIRVLTVNPSRDFGHALKLFQQQWGGSIEARQGSKELHDRFLLVDDRVFVSGASFKDLGRKGSVLTEVRTQTAKEAIRKDIEAWWEAAQPIT